MAPLAEAECEMSNRDHSKSLSPVHSGKREAAPRRNETRSALWGEHFKDPIVALDKALKCVENSCLKSGPGVVWR